MSYRPITDVWILARPKVKYYGAYPNGFLERALMLLGGVNAATLHVCGGHAKEYPNARLMRNGWTLDLDRDTNPDFHADAREALPLRGSEDESWDAILIDPPYTEADAEKYRPGAGTFPSANLLLRNALAAVDVGGRVGMLHYLLPQPPSDGVRFIACVGVIVGYNNRMRVFSVFERTK
jgi:hypothetical protein